MSIKTIAKPISIALTAMLGFGFITAIPAQANPSAVRMDGTPQSFMIRTDAAADLEIDLESSAAIADQTDITVTLKRNNVSLPSAPAGFTIAWTTNAAERPGTAGADDPATANDFTVDADNLVSAADVKLADITVARTLAPGKYELGVTVAGAVEVVFTIYVSTKPTAFNLSATSGTVDAGGTRTFTIGVKDAQGNPSYLIPGEAADLALTGGVTGATRPTIDVPFLDSNNVTNTSLTGPTVTISAAAGVTAGVYTITAKNAAGLSTLADAIYTVTAGAAPATVTALALGSTASMNVDGDGDGTYDETGDNSATTAAARPAQVSTSVRSVTFVAATAATSGTIRFTVTAAGTGLPAGVAASTATNVAIVDNGATASPRYTASLTLTALAPAAGYGYTVATSTGGFSWTVLYQTPVANSVTTVDTLLDGGTIAAVKKGSTTVAVVVSDQFGDAIPNTAVIFSVAGRNVSNAGDVTNASGQASYSFSDVSVATTGFTDTMTATITGSQPTGAPAVDNTASVVVNYVDSLNVDKVTLAGTANTDDDASLAYDEVVAADGTTALTLKTNTTALDATATPDIVASDQIRVTATVTDSLGNVLQGIRVRFTGSVGVFFAADSANQTIVPVAGATARTSIEVYTDVNGVARAQARGTNIGTMTVTSTAEGKTGSVSAKLANAAADARNISTAAVSGTVNQTSVASFTVKDGFGNLVAGVTVNFSVTGVGTFLNGTNAVNGVTDANGVATVAVVSSRAGTATVTGSLSTAAGDYPQAGAAAVTALGFAAGVKSASSTVTVAALPAPEPVYEKPTLSFVQSGGRVFLSGTAVEGEGDIIIYVKRVGTTTWIERAKTLEVAAPGDFNGSIKAPRGNVVIRVKQEGTGMFSNQVLIVK